jgi:hypothetical protein
MYNPRCCPGSLIVKTYSDFKNNTLIILLTDMYAIRSMLTFLYSLNIKFVFMKTHRSPGTYI